MKIKRKKSDNFWDRLVNTLLFLLSGFILMLCALILFSTKGHCSTISEANGSLPYKKSQILTYNSFMTNDILERLRTLNLPIDDNKYVLMYSDHSPFTQYPQYNNQYDVTYYFFLLPVEEFNSVYDGYNFYLNNLAVTLTPNSYYYYIGVTCDLTSNFELIAIRPPSYTPYATSLYNSGMFGHVPSVDNISGFTFTSMSPVYFNTDFYSVNDVLVLDYTEQSFVHYEGHATPPDEFDEPIYPTGSTIPSHVPHLTINNYTWTTAPTPDLSTLEKTAESTYNLLKWLCDNLLGALTNLVNNIGAIGQYIGETIQYYGNLIIKNIQNGITTFYNNMVSLFEPISSALDYISQPLQVEEVVTAMQSTAIHTDIVSVVNLSNTAFGIFGTVSEPSEFKIPLDLTGITILHQTQPFYIDLGWINSAKSYIRAFMWCVVTFGLLYSIIIGIPSMLKDSK